MLRRGCTEQVPRGSGLFDVHAGWMISDFLPGVALLKSASCRPENRYASQMVHRSTAVR
jgi:hypothetical protein